MTTEKKKAVEVKIQLIHCYLQNSMDITNNFCPSEEDKLDGSTLNSTMFGTS